jgi:hypothetical protein
MYWSGTCDCCCDDDDDDDDDIIIGLCNVIKTINTHINYDIELLKGTFFDRFNWSVLKNAFKLSQDSQDENGDEFTGTDQCIVPIDLNIIVDDEIKSIIQDNLKEGVTLFALFDSCYDSLRKSLNKISSLRSLNQWGKRNNTIYILYNIINNI